MNNDHEKRDGFKVVSPHRRGMAVGLEVGICEEGNEAGEWVEIEEGNAGAAGLRREEIADRNAIKEF
jgi:hypothetical protein